METTILPEVTALGVIIKAILILALFQPLQGLVHLLNEKYLHLCKEDLDQCMLVLMDYYN